MLGIRAGLSENDVHGRTIIIPVLCYAHGRRPAVVRARDDGKPTRGMHTS